MSDVEQVDEGEVRVDLSHHGVDGPGHPAARCFVNATLQLALSTPGLVVLVVLYSVMGALIFPLLEAPADVQMAATVSSSRDECLKELWTITERLNVLYERNWTMLVHEQLRRFEGSIVAATKGGLAETMGDQWPRWTFGEALLYSVTVITTIGHGNLTPRTSEGKVVTMAYAIVGVPLMLMCLSSLGGFLAEALQCSYGRLCGGTEGGLSGGHRSSRRPKHQDDDHRRHHGNNCHQTETETDCNFCDNKYDAVCAEKQAKMQTFDKHNVAANEREDSCRLIHSSPVKSIMATKTTPPTSPPSSQRTLNHSSPLKHGPTPCNGRNSMDPSSGAAKHNLNNQNHHQQQQQQSFHQPDSLFDRSSAAAAAINNRTINVYFPVNNRLQMVQHPQQLQLQQQQQQQQHPNVKLVHLHQPHLLALHHQTTVPPPAGFGSGHSTMLIQQQMPNNYHQSVQLAMHQQHGANNEYRLVQQQTAGSPQHTATVHGLGRSKFQPKPLPPEINVLMAAECEANNCQQRESSLQSSSSSSSNNESACDRVAEMKCGVAAAAGVASSLETLDDDDDEDNRTIGCPHGTPSRIPLIKTKSKSTDQHKRYNCASPGDYQSVTQTDDGIDDDEDQSSQQTSSHSPQVPITLILVILIGYIAIGTAIFSLWENWSIVDGAYFCFVTLSTIGFGDLVPKKTFHGPDIQLFACCAYLVLGLVLVAMSFSLLETQLLWKCRRMAVRLKLASD